MLSIIRCQSDSALTSNFLDAAVTIRDDKNENIPGYPDLTFQIRTYVKVSSDRDDSNGDSILLATNLLFSGMTLQDHKVLYKMYSECKQLISKIKVENRRETIDMMQEVVYDTMRTLNLPERAIALCRTDRFEYPGLSEVGTEAHHTPDMTFLIEDYIEITAISVITKMMVPIWGELLWMLGVIEVQKNQRERIAYDILKPTLEEGIFERVMNRISHFRKTRIKRICKEVDKRSGGNTKVEYIMIHSGVNEEMFDELVMASIIVKRLATYGCLATLDNEKSPDVMVYITEIITRTTESTIQAMRDKVNTMPRIKMTQHGDDNNDSIIDYISKTSNRPVDDPIFVITAAREWEIPKLIVETDTPIDVFTSACDYYAANVFDISPLTQAMVASFVGTRFGGSKCLNYLTIPIYQQLVILLQVYLIRQGLLDLASLVSSKTSPQPVEGLVSTIGAKIDAKLESEEYRRCVLKFKGSMERKILPIGKRNFRPKEIETDRLDFVNHIKKMIEWLKFYTHSENMAPALWTFAKVDVRPQTGDDCQFDENVIQNLCSFYLTFHDGHRPL